MSHTKTNPTAFASRESYPAIIAPNTIKVVENINFPSGYIPRSMSWTIIVAKIAHLLLVNKRGILQNLAAYSPKRT